MMGLAEVPEKVALVMVTYNRYEVLLESIKAIQNQIRPVDYFIIVDNGSTDDTRKHLTLVSNDITVVALNENGGYAAGLAYGMQYALKVFSDIDYFWLMDDDSHPSPAALAGLLRLRQGYSYHGILSVTGFIDTIWNGPIRLMHYPKKSTKLISAEFSLYEADHALIDGAIIDRLVVDQIGFPDGKFFMMCEDVEYCRRIKKAGFKIIVWDQEAMMDRLHVGGGGRFSRSNLWRGYYGARNHLLILKEYFSVRAMISYMIRQVKYLLAGLTAKDRFRRFYLRSLGIWHGLKGISGKTIDPQKF